MECSSQAPMLERSVPSLWCVIGGCSTFEEVGPGWWEKAAIEAFGTGAQVLYLEVLVPYDGKSL